MLMHTVMHCSKGLYMAQRRFISCGRSHAADPNYVMLACVHAGTLLYLAGWNYQAERLAGWT